jgi:hypothetical protein
VCHLPRNLSLRAGHRIRQSNGSGRLQVMSAHGRRRLSTDASSPGLLAWRCLNPAGPGTFEEPWPSAARQQGCLVRRRGPQSRATRPESTRFPVPFSERFLECPRVSKITWWTSERAADRSSILGPSSRRPAGRASSWKVEWLRAHAKCVSSSATRARASSTRTPRRSSIRGRPPSFTCSTRSATCPTKSRSPSTWWRRFTEWPCSFVPPRPSMDGAPVSRTGSAANAAVHPPPRGRLPKAVEPRTEDCLKVLVGRLGDRCGPRGQARQLRLVATR